MAGLLYKDFKAIKGHYYAITFIIITVLLIPLRLFFCTAEVDVIVALWLSMAPFVLLGILLVKVEIGIIAADEEKNAQLYLLSLPMSVKNYIASKYWFMLIGHYVVLSISMLWNIAYQIQIADESMSELLASITSLMPSLVCGSICIVAIELPFFIISGSKKGEMIKTVILLSVLLAMLIFLLFGDLSVLDLLDLEKMMLFLEEHIEVLLKIQIFAPMLSLLFYYGSYCITCSIFKRREICYES